MSFILSSLQPLIQKHLLALNRRRMLATIAAKRDATVITLMVGHLPASGVWTHDHPLMAPELEQLGLPVRVGLPDEERALMQVYPQPRGRETSVEYVPGGPLPPGVPPGRDVPRQTRDAPTVRRR